MSEIFIYVEIAYTQKRIKTILESLNYCASIPDNAKLIVRNILPTDLKQNQMKVVVFMKCQNKGVSSTRKKPKFVWQTGRYVPSSHFSKDVLM